jgi:hypothetical protein
MCILFHRFEARRRCNVSHTGVRVSEASCSKGLSLRQSGNTISQSTAYESNFSSVEVTAAHLQYTQQLGRMPKSILN